MLLLVSNIRKILLWVCLVPTLMVFFLLFIAALNQRFSGIEPTIWTWFALAFVPCLALLLTSAILNKNTGKFVYRPVFYIILVALIAYFVTLIFVVMTMGSSGVGVEAHFKSSYLYVLPFSFAISAVFALLFFKKDSIFIPNQNLIKQHAVGLLNNAKTTSNLAQQQALENLVAGDYTAVFTKIQAFFKQNTAFDSEHSQALLLQSQYNMLQEQTNLGLADEATAQRNLNRITLSLIELAKKIA